MPRRRILCPTNCAKTASCLTRADNEFRSGRLARAGNASWCSTRRRRRNSPRSFCIKIGEASKDSNRVEVPFEQIAPADAEFWTDETTERTARAHRPLRRDQTAISRHRQRHAPARAHRRQNRFRQIHAVPRHHHQPRAAVQPGAGRVLSRGLQERRRVQMLRAAAVCRTRESWPSRATANSA